MSIDPTPAYRPTAYVIESVPEPSTCGLLISGALGLIALARRRQAK